MRGQIANGRAKALAAAILLSVSLAGSSWAVTAESPAKALEVPNDLAVRYGEEMYRKGVLPSGEPMMAVVKDDIPVEGTAFSCESCHLRGGMGSTEGGVYTPPTNGSRLFQPLKKFFRGVEVKYGEDPLVRPAYTDRSLAELLRYGMDPTGRIINDVMPRYELNDTDMGYMIAFLKKLSAEFSPGVSDTTVRFATIYTEDASPEDRDALVSTLEAYVTSKNATSRYFRSPRTASDRIMAKSMLRSKAIDTRNVALSQWVLKGPPETWRSQLDEYLRTDPVFAVLGGVTGDGEWRPVHAFCEDNRLPCIFPSTDFPVISDSEWYTLYVSKGYYQEGEAAARYLNNEIDSFRNKKVVQLVRDSRIGKALADGFGETWQGFERPALKTVLLKEGEPLTRSRVEKVLATEKPAALLVWDDAGAIPALDAVTGKNRTKMVFLSSSYLGDRMLQIPEKIRGVTYLAYPYRLPQDIPLDPMGGELHFQVADNKVAKQAFALVQVVSMAMMELRSNYYRDTFLDVISNSMDRVVPLYERLSFGPGQRYASKGCYIVQLSPGSKPELVKKSPWVIH